jgi:hypothetical protein
MGPLVRMTFALLAILALASTGLAQVGEEKETADFAMTGDVKAVDAAKGTVTLEGANREGGTLGVDPKAEMRNGDHPIALGDLKVGWRVAVNGDIRDGKKVVTYLEVVEIE